LCADFIIHYVIKIVIMKSYQFVIVGHIFTAVSIGKHKQLAVAVECQVHVEPVRYAGQVVRHPSGFDFGERRGSGVRFGTWRAASPSLCKATRHLQLICKYSVYKQFKKRML